MLMENQINLHKTQIIATGVLQCGKNAFVKQKMVQYNSAVNNCRTTLREANYIYWLLFFLLAGPACIPAFGGAPHSLVAKGPRPRFDRTVNKERPVRPRTYGNLFFDPYLKQNPITQLLRLKLVLDAFNYDDIAIGFCPTASPKYDPNEDSAYMEGIDAPEGLSSFSSDGMRLSVNVLPLPKLKPLLIRLDVEARFTATYTLQRTELTDVPAIYEIWLIDKYKKDSLDIRAFTGYTFDVNISDTASYGANRFSVIIRQNPALGVRLLNFGALKATGGVQTTWQTKNEQDSTHFTVERSSDNGATFQALGGAISTGAGSYSYLDNAPPATTDLYRLKMDDLYGTITYSDVITVAFGNSGSLAGDGIQVYPNPTTGMIKLAIIPTGGAASVVNSGHAIGLGGNPDDVIVYGIKIINITGRIVKTATSSQPNWQEDVAGLSPGTYIIQVQNNFDNSLVGKRTFTKL
jgi:trimeric autotransporter adhesin